MWRILLVVPLMVAGQAHSQELLCTGTQSANFDTREGAHHSSDSWRGIYDLGRMTYRPLAEAAGEFEGTGGTWHLNELADGVYEISVGVFEFSPSLEEFRIVTFSRGHRVFSLTVVSHWEAMTFSSGSVVIGTCAPVTE